MNFNQMPIIILTVVMIGLVVGVGVLLLDEFGEAVEDNVQIVNETVAIASGTGTLGRTDTVSRLTNVNNYTDTWTTTAYYNATGTEFANTSFIGAVGGTAGATWNYTSAGVITTNASDGNYNFTYYANIDSAGTTVTHSGRDAVDDFVTWIPTIIILVALGIILGLIVKAFRQ